MLPDPPLLLAFLAAMLAVNLTPGPDMMFVVARSLAQGRMAGLVSAFGIGAGCVVHTAVAGFGLAAVLQRSPELFLAVQYVGAGYLVWLGIAAWRDIDPRPDRVGDTAPDPIRKLARVFVQGVATNLLNPKVALFFLAFLPQFVASDPELARGQMIALGLLFVVSGTAVNAGVALGLGAAGERLLRQPGLSRWPRRVAGTVLVALGLRIALSDVG